MQETLIFDQVHLGVPDPAAAAAWYVERLGARPGDNVDRVWFGDIRVIFLKNAAPGRSDGTAIDHFALSVPSIQAQLRSLEGSGARVLTPAFDHAGLHPSAFIEDPWGSKIELVEDAERAGFHHVQLQVPDPSAARQWYVDRFGGTPGKFKGRVDGLQYGGVWVFLGEHAAAPPSKGHAIDHVGWRMPDLLAKADELRGMGVTFTTEPVPGPPGPFSPVLMSFTEDPWGVKIELLQRRGE
jgi:catechol 2,3-dioxygenase-like lactoylglutathione lyase family enzyme